MFNISEEIWQNLGAETLCINENWPTEKVKKINTLNIAVQIDGKIRCYQNRWKFQKGKVLEMAKNSDKIKKNIFDKDIKREIYKFLER